MGRDGRLPGHLCRFVLGHQRPLGAASNIPGDRPVRGALNSLSLS